MGAGDGSDFTVAIIEGDKNVLLCSFKSTSEQCQAIYDWKVGGRPNMTCISSQYIEYIQNINIFKLDVFQTDRLEVTLKKPPLVNKDVKFMFTCSTKGVPVGYDNCAFFFWLNTFFIKYEYRSITEQLITWRTQFC